MSDSRVETEGRFPTLAIPLSFWEQIGREPTGFQVDHERACTYMHTDDPNMRRRFQHVTWDYPFKENAKTPNPPGWNRA